MNIIKDLIQEINHGNTFKFTTDQVFNAFKQGEVDLPLLRRIGGGGNCASIALIKAAIATYGLKNILKSVVIDDANERFIIDLKDEEEFVYSLSYVDYLYGAERSAFVLTRHDDDSKVIFEFGKFLFAVMAEVKRVSGYRRPKRFKYAVTDLNKGEPTDVIFELLGLDIGEVKDVSLDNLATSKNLIVYNAVHAVFSSEGMYDEFFNGYAPVENLRRLQEIHGDGSEYYAPCGAYSLK